MIGLISIYIKKLAVYMIFTFFINIFLPDNSFKRHIYFVLGIIIIINVISPLTGIGKSLEDYTFNVDKRQVENQIKYYEANQTDILLNKFNSDLESRISNLPSIKSVKVTSEIRNNTLYIEKIDCVGTSKAVVSEISKTYNIPEENIYFTGVDTNGN